MEILGYLLVNIYQMEILGYLLVIIISNRNSVIFTRKHYIKWKIWDIYSETLYQMETLGYLLVNIYQMEILGYLLVNIISNGNSGIFTRKHIKWKF